MSVQFAADSLVVGGGVIGVSIAYHLAQRGQRVLLLERRRVGGGATEKAGGMLAPLEEAEEDGPWLWLAMDSYRRYPALFDALPGVLRVQVREAGAPGSLIRMATCGAEATSLQERLTWLSGCGLQQHWVDAVTLQSLEPRVSEACPGGLLTEQLSIEPMTLCQAMLDAAGKAIQVIQGDARELLVKGGQAIGVRTASGEMIHADDVVIAGGAWSRELLDGDAAAHLPEGWDLPVSPVRGQILAYEQPEVPVRHVWWGAGYLIPRQDIFVLGATTEVVGFDESVSTEGVGTLRRALGEMMPSLGDATPIRMWAGLRPQIADGLPVLGPLPGLRRAWLATGHYRNGVLLAPGTGHWMADAICKGAVDDALAPFAPSRFLNEDKRTS